MTILQVLYIISSFVLIYGASVIYNGNRNNSKHRAFALLFVFMALWQQSALLISLVPPEQALYVFMYGLIPLILGSFILLLHSVYLITGIYKSRFALVFKLLFLPPVINVLLFPVDGWLYSDDIVMYSSHSSPGPGGFINFAVMFIYMIVMAALLLPRARDKHRPSQIWLIGLVSYILWSLTIIVVGEATGSWDSFSLVPLGINFWALAVYVSVRKYDSLPSFERRYKILFDRSPIGLMVVDSKGIIHEASPRAAEMMGVPLNQLLGKSIFDGYNEEKKAHEYKLYLDNIHQRRTIQQYEVSFQDPNGQTKYLSVNSDFMEMEGEVYQLLMFADITEAKLKEKQIHDLAYYDTLTELYNRISFNQKIREWQQEKEQFALIILDLDDFKSINDQYGHLVGDQALKYFAAQLIESVREEDFVARLSGDEFVIMMSGDGDYEHITESVRQRLLQPLEISEGVRLELSTSIGLSIYPEDGEDLDTLFKAADDRMYEDKRRKKKLQTR